MSELTYAAAYLLVGFAIMCTVWYFAPWEKGLLTDTPVGIFAVLGWPVALMICFAAFVHGKGVARRIRIEVERKRREKEEKEIDRIIAEQKL